MISIEDRKAFANAEQKAREIQPRVSMEEFGSYKVASATQGNLPYTVKFVKTPTGHWAASCTCPAHTGDKTGRGKMQPNYKPKACYHIPAAYSAHRIQVGIRQQVRASQEAQEPDAGPILCATCGEAGNVWTGSEWLCWSHALETAEAREKAAQIAEAERLYPDLLEPIYKEAVALTKTEPSLDFCLTFSCDGQPGPTGFCQDCETVSNNAALAPVLPAPIEVNQICRSPRNEVQFIPTPAWAAAAMSTPPGDYTEAQARQDHTDLFGFAPVHIPARSNFEQSPISRAKEEW